MRSGFVGPACRRRQRGAADRSGDVERGEPRRESGQGFYCWKPLTPSGVPKVFPEEGQERLVYHLGDIFFRWLAILE